MRLVLLCMLLSLCLAPGCSGPTTSSAGHVVFSSGEPVQSGSIEFRSLESGNRYSSRLDEQGRFELADADGRVGIAPGEYEVVVVQIVLTEDLALDKHSHGKTVPRRYADYYTSDVRAAIVENSTKPIRVVVEDT